MFEIYKGKKVLVTGHAGMKGSWLSLWLRMLGAEVYGIGHLPKEGPGHYKILMEAKEDIFEGDYYNNLSDISTLNGLEPDIVFHLAANAIVADTFKYPVETFENNVMGAVHLLELCKECPSVKGVVAITSDKVYKSKEWNYAYREVDELGADDPYSTSKVCVEHVIECYRKSYNMNIATARAGNIIGGGDWGPHRLIPDIVRATVKNQPVQIHTPHATRPFQHVLDALYGYLLLGEKILAGEDVNREWNFGPDAGEMSVLEVLKTAKSVWPDIEFEVDNRPTHPFMVYLLKLDSSDSKKILGWKPVLAPQSAVEATIYWYRRYLDKGRVMSKDNIKAYMEAVKNVHM